MKKIYFLLSILVFNISCNYSVDVSTDANDETSDSLQQTQKAPFGIVIHGGAGYIKKGNLSDSLENAYREKLKEAITKGNEILKNGGSAVEAVKQTINVMEDSPLFNSGKGAVLTHEEKPELDASIMDGKTLNAGGVAGVSTVKNPINLAYEVMEHSDHVLLAREGAEAFAKTRNLEIVDPSYFITDKQLQNIKRIKEEAVNKTCAVSGTGWGEYYIRGVVAYDISALMEYKGLSLEEATKKVIHEKQPELGGNGGIIAIDHLGNFSIEFNTPGMFRASFVNDKLNIQMYKE